MVVVERCMHATRKRPASIPKRNYWQYITKPRYFCRFSSLTRVYAHSYTRIPFRITVCERTKFFSLESLRKSNNFVMKCRIMVRQKNIYDELFNLISDLKTHLLKNRNNLLYNYIYNNLFVRYYLNIKSI